MTVLWKGAATTCVRMGSTKLGKLAVQWSFKISRGGKAFNSLALVYWDVEKDSAMTPRTEILIPAASHDAAIRRHSTS